MWRATRLFLTLGIAICGVCKGQTLPTTTIFPSDAQDPKVSGGAELLETVCPGDVFVGKSITCRGVCPNDTSFQGERSLEAVTRGHFLSTTSDDAVLSMLGCEPHSEKFGGTILLTRNAGRWKMLWYKAGVETSECHKVSLPTGREILVCMGRYGAQGNESTELYVEDLLSPIGSLMAGTGGFFQVLDTTLTCGWNEDDQSKPYPLKRGYIERVSFGSDAAGRATVSVTSQTGTRKMSPDDVQACQVETNPLNPHPHFSIAPRTSTSHMDFVFNGHDFVPLRPAR